MAKQLNLMVMDEEQLYAEKLVSLLGHYFDDINLGFWDEKAELIKALRNDWDVLVFCRAYDMNFTELVGVLQEQGASLPIIHLIKAGDTPLLNEVGFPQIIDTDMITTLTIGQDFEIVLAICLLAAYSQNNRQMKNLRNILKESEQRANILIANSKSAVAYIDQGVHIFANEPYLEMFGYNSMEEIIGVPVVDLISGGDNVKGFKQFLRKFDKGDRSQVEFDFESKRTDGTTFASKLQLASATLDGEPVVQMIIQHNDANAEELARQLAAVARQDTLTGLANRTGFSEEMVKVFDEAQRGVSCALLYISMDNIGKINSSAGITGVDTSVKYLGHLLNEAFDMGFVSRFSDSTFAVLLTEVKKEQALELAEKVRAKAETLLIEIGTRTVTTTLSIGVVMMDVSSSDPDTIVARATDTVSAILSDTDGVGNQVRLFDISAHAGEDEGALAEYIQAALTQNRFNLKYQPVYDINTDSSDLFEVYVTLPMADGTELTLDKFSPIAKKRGLIDKIDRWVLINACKQLAITRKEHPNARLLVGLSSDSLADGNLAEMTAKLVKAVGSHGTPLSLQFLEQDLVDYLAVAKRQFMALSNIGCPVVIQNFGTTAKSEEIVGMLNPTMARLARSYTKDLDRPNNLETTQKLVARATEQGCDILMPYIEDAQTMSMAWSIGARFLQGNYLQPADTSLVYAPPAEEEM